MAPPHHRDRRHLSDSSTHVPGLSEWRGTRRPRAVHRPLAIRAPADHYLGRDLQGGGRRIEVREVWKAGMGERGIKAAQSEAESIWRYWRFLLERHKPHRTKVRKGSGSGSEREWEYELGSDCVNA